MARGHLLDELVFVRPPLAWTPQASPCDYSHTLQVAGTEHQLQFASPWFLRHLPAELNGQHWSLLCPLLRKHHVSVYCAVEKFEGVPAAAVPIRLSQRNVGEPLRSLDFKSADAFEVTCQTAASLAGWRWPSELGEPARLPALLSTLRVAAGGTTPIGIGLPLGAATGDIDACLAAPVDFVSLIDDSSGGAAADETLLVESLVRTRHRCVEQGQPQLPILLAADIQQPDHLLKLLALGATAVSIDGLLQPALRALAPPAAQTPTGMLSGISSLTPPKTDFSPVELVLKRLHQQLARCAADARLGRLAELQPSHLKATSERSAVCTQLPRLRP